MTTIQRITIKGSQRPVKGARKASPRLTHVELADNNPKDNAQRLADYIGKRTAMERAA